MQARRSSALASSSPGSEEESTSSPESEEEDDLPPVVLGDWRAFRARLVEGGLPVVGEADSATSNATKLSKPKAKLDEANVALAKSQSLVMAAELSDPGAVWAHEVSSPEVGCLLIRLPLEAAIVLNKESHWGGKLREGDPGFLSARGVSFSFFSLRPSWAPFVESCVRNAALSLSLSSSAGGEEYAVFFQFVLDMSIRRVLRAFPQKYLFGGGEKGKRGKDTLEQRGGGWSRESRTLRRRIRAVGAVQREATGRPQVLGRILLEPRTFVQILTISHARERERERGVCARARARVQRAALKMEGSVSLVSHTLSRKERRFDAERERERAQTASASLRVVSSRRARV